MTSYVEAAQVLLRILTKLYILQPKPSKIPKQKPTQCFVALTSEALCFPKLRDPTPQTGPPRTLLPIKWLHVLRTIRAYFFFTQRDPSTLDPKPVKFRVQHKQNKPKPLEMQPLSRQTHQSLHDPKLYAQAHAHNLKPICPSSNFQLPPEPPAPGKKPSCRPASR